MMILLDRRTMAIAIMVAAAADLEVTPGRSAMICCTMIFDLCNSYVNV